MIAHRGASAAAPENTIQAFALARALGADAVELDVRLTVDGELAVTHDAHLPDGRRVAELARRDLPTDVPLLEEALDACRGMGVNIEIKTARAVDGVVAVLRRRPAGDDVLVSSFDVETVEQVRARAPSVLTALLTWDLPDPAAAVESAAARGHSAIHPFVATVDATLVTRAHEAGLAVNVWTVDDPEAMAGLAVLGVDGIVTNVPDVALAVLRA